MGKSWPFGAAWDRVLLAPLGASPGSGPPLCVCLRSTGRPAGRKEGKSCVSAAQDSGSRSFRSTQVSSSPTARGGLCGHLGKGSLGSDPVPTAHHPCPHPLTGSPGDPGSEHPFPVQPHPVTPLGWLMPSTAPDAPTEAAETYGVRGSPVRGCAGAAARQPRRLAGVLGPGSFPRAGRTLVSRSAKPHPESSPASRRGGAYAGVLCPTPASAR